jgi:hypothetical protein
MQVDEFGGEEFVAYLLGFLDSSRLLTPLCSLLHVLCFGAHKDMIVEGMQGLVFCGVFYGGF